MSYVIIACFRICSCSVAGLSTAFLRQTRRLPTPYLDIPAVFTIKIFRTAFHSTDTIKEGDEDRVELLFESPRLRFREQPDDGARAQPPGFEPERQSRAVSASAVEEVGVRSGAEGGHLRSRHRLIPRR